MACDLIDLTTDLNDFTAIRVYMRCVTWSRDSHGLFDYESRFISKKNIKTVQDGRIVRLNNDVELIGMNQSPEDLDPQAKPLITITQNARGKNLEPKLKTQIMNSSSLNF